LSPAGRSRHKQHARAASAAGAGDHVRKPVRQLLTFSRLQPVEPLAQPLQAVIDEGLDILRATLPAQVTVDRRLADAPLIVRIDGTQGANGYLSSTAIR